jgi:hypothetical protein
MRSFFDSFEMARVWQRGHSAYLWKIRKTGQGRVQRNPQFEQE